VYDQITGKLDLGFQDIGEQTLKNISRPIRVYRVSGTAKPQRAAPPAPPARRAHGSLPWAIAGVVVAIVGAAAWELGWLSFGAPGRGSSGAPAPVAAPSASTPSPPQRADRQPTTADAAAVKEQAQAELARARSEAEAARAARAQADAEAAANRVRGQALADAARIRAEAEASAARTRSDAASATREAGSQAAAASTPVTRTAPSGSAEPAVAATASIATDKPAPARAGATTAGGTRFDGAWSVSVACEPMGARALGYKFDFVAQVKDNFLRGERRSEGSPGWIKLQGPIQPDGKATFDAQGLTDDPKYANGVAYGTPYAYHVAAQFDSDRGTGRRLELRACNLSFAKQ
jgi:hypothetical protein